MLGFWAPFLALCQKRRPFRRQFSKNNFWKHLWSRRGYSRDYFKPNLRSLRPWVCILQGFEFESRHVALWSNFWPFIKFRGPLNFNFRLRISGNIFEHEEDFQRFFFHTNSRPLGLLVCILQGFESRQAAFWSDFVGPLSNFEAVPTLILAKKFRKHLRSHRGFFIAGPLAGVGQHPPPTAAVLGF